MPSDEDAQTLLKTVFTFFDPKKNHNAIYLPPLRRLFHRDRNYALLLLLLDTAARISETLYLKMEDYQPERRQIVITKSKGREPRILPLSVETITAIDTWLKTWLKVRERVMREAKEDEGWLFLSELGAVMDSSKFLKSLKGYIRFVGLSESITLHSLRRYSLNRLAKTNLLAAQPVLIFLFD